MPAGFPGIRCRSIHIFRYKKGDLGDPGRKPIITKRIKFNGAVTAAWSLITDRAYRVRQLILVGDHRAAFSLANAHAPPRIAQLLSS